MSHTTLIKPRFSETDKLGHISNTVFPVWMAESRSDFARETLKITQPWVVANISVDFKKEVTHGENVIITTDVMRIGNKSVTFYQEVFQHSTLCATGSTTVVCIDPHTKETQFMNNDDKKKLMSFMLEKEKPA